MSQNGPYSGPPWSHGSSDEPYAEPADPWSDHGNAVPDPAWGAHPPSVAVPQQPHGYHPPAGSSGWSGGQPAPPKRNTPIVALVVTLGVLFCVGLAATVWLLTNRTEPAAIQAQESSPSPAAPAGNPQPLGSEDARFYAKKGDCIINDGTDEEPKMKKSVCVDGAFEVLKRVEGKTTGEKDAETKCAEVTGYTKWYFYDSALDDFDFVLCLKDHKAL